MVEWCLASLLYIESILGMCNFRIESPFPEGIPRIVSQQHKLPTKQPLADKQSEQISAQQVVNRI